MAVKLLLDGARGLEYMHQAGICHADVKSRNLLVFYDEDEGKVDADQQQNQDDDAAAAAGDGGQGAAADPAAAAPVSESEGEGAAAGTGGQVGEEEGAKKNEDEEQMWTLKWCDFGISFAAKECGGVSKKVSSGMQCLVALSAARAVYLCPGHVGKL
jgi:serine/threonine protein kinase